MSCGKPPPQEINVHVKDLNLDNLIASKWEQMPIVFLFHMLIWMIRNKLDDMDGQDGCVDVKFN